MPGCNAFTSRFTCSPVSVNISDLSVRRVPRACSSFITRASSSYDFDLGPYPDLDRDLDLDRHFAVNLIFPKEYSSCREWGEGNISRLIVPS